MGRGLEADHRESSSQDQFGEVVVFMVLVMVMVEEEEERGGRRPAGFFLPLLLPARDRLGSPPTSNRKTDSGSDSDGDFIPMANSGSAVDADTSLPGAMGVRFFPRWRRRCEVEVEVDTNEEEQGLWAQ